MVIILGDLKIACATNTRMLSFLLLLFAPQRLGESKRCFAIKTRELSHRKGKFRNQFCSMDLCGLKVLDIEFPRSQCWLLTPWKPFSFFGCTKLRLLSVKWYVRCATCQRRYKMTYTSTIFQTMPDHMRRVFERTTTVSWYASHIEDPSNSRVHLSVPPIALLNRPLITS